MTESTSPWLAKVIGLAIAMSWCAATADVANAAVITLKDGTRFGCFIVQKGKTDVVVDAVDNSGKRTRKTLKIEDVDNVDYAVSASRLAKLDPAKPLLYKEYAEELANVTIDPEARPMSLRLYQIALNLAPAEFAESCLLGMIRIARDRDEERRLRAAAFLHLRNQDDAVIAPPSKVASGGQKTKDLDQESQLRLLREIRTRKRTAVRANEAAALRKALSPFADSFSDEKLIGLFAFECTNCENGKVACPYCERGWISSRNRRTKCTRCQRGKADCAVCDASNGRPPLPEDVAARIVSAEIRLLSEQLSPADLDAKQPDETPQSWSQIRSSARRRTILPLNLGKLTEFDPAKSLFRDGKWVAP